MTGPTGIIQTDNGLKVLGYPNAKHLKVVDSPLGRRLSQLRLHLSDLIMCESWIQDLGQHRRSKPEIPPDQTELAIFIAALVKFFGCFGDSKARFSLQPRAIYKDADAIEVFEHFKAMRNNNIVHDSNNYNYSITTAALGEQGDVVDIVSLAFHTYEHSIEAYQNFFNLASFAKAYVETQIESLLAKLFEELEHLSITKRMDLPNVEYSKPKPGDVHKKR